MPVTGPLGSATVAGPLPLRLAASPAMPLPVSGARAVIMMALRAFNLSLPTRARARAREALRGPGVLPGAGPQVSWPSGQLELEMARAHLRLVVSAASS